LHCGNLKLCSTISSTVFVEYHVTVNTNGNNNTHVDVAELDNQKSFSVGVVAEKANGQEAPTFARKMKLEKIV
jgi:hypothetical protein